MGQDPKTERTPEIEEISPSLEKLIVATIEANFKSVKEQVENIQKTVDTTNSQLADDRKDISDMKVNQEKIEAIVKGLRDDLHRQTKTITNKVDEHLEGVPDVVALTTADTINEQMDKKPKIYIKKTSLLRRLFKRR